MSKPHVFTVTPGVHCVMRRSYFTNCYLIETTAGLVAIDAGMKSNGSEMLAAISQLGRLPKDVCTILLTHWHNDHAAGASELARLSGADVYYSAREAGHLTRSVAAVGFRGRLAAAVPESGPLVLLKGLLGNAPQRAVEATRFVRPGESIQGFIVIDTPGHTSGHVSYWYEPAKVLFAGDALAVIRQRLRFMARPTVEDVLAARTSMSRCLELPIAYICPGHREPLIQNVAKECERLRAVLASGGRWPLFG